jgi:hypothetical protein
VVEFQIQSVIDLEARAYARGDKELYLQQQDADDRDWYRAQQERFSAECLRVHQLLGSAAPLQTVSSYLRCRPVLEAEIKEVQLRGDIAWVQVIEGEPAVRRARFYRQTEQGWKHTAPQDAFWGVAIQLSYGDLVFRYHRRDQPYVDDLVDHIQNQYQDLCMLLYCPDESIEFNFAVDSPASRYMRLRDNVFLLPSPWLSGIPIQEEWDPDYLLQLEYAITYELTALHFRSLTGQDLTPLQRAIASEYAAWQSTQDPSQAPLLGRLAAQSGYRAPEILISLMYHDTLDMLIANWLDLSAAGDPVTYFQFLLNVERDAVLTGRESTFLLLQDDTRMSWLMLQRNRFNSVRSQDTDWPRLRVRNVGFSGNVARVTIENAGTTNTGNETVFFRRSDGSWKHTAPVQARGSADSYDIGAI